MSESWSSAYHPQGSIRRGLHCLNILGAAIKSVNTGVVIGDKLDNQIFGLSQ